MTEKKGEWKLKSVLFLVKNASEKGNKKGTERRKKGGEKKVQMALKCDCLWREEKKKKKVNHQG